MLSPLLILLLQDAKTDAAAELGIRAKHVKEVYLISEVAPPFGNPVRVAHPWFILMGDSGRKINEANAPARM